MSSSNISPNSEKTSNSRYFINHKNQRIHQDAIGQEWMMKAPTGGYDTGFESIFYNAILDQDFKTAVYEKIENATKNMETLKYNDKWYNIFINEKETDNTTISTKSELKYNDITDEEKIVEDKPKQSQGEGKKRDRSIVDKWKFHKQLLQDAEKEIPLEKFWVIEKGVMPIIVQEGMQKYILTRLNHITFNY